MDKVIKIYNPKDLPFGPLSNNYVQSMVIDDKRWNTVTNYILSNMLITPIYRTILQMAVTKGSPKKTNIEEKVKKIAANIESKQKRRVDASEMENIRRTVTTEVAIQKMDIYELYYYYLAQEHFDNLRTAVEKAYNAKISENSSLVDALMSTENRPILYISNNSDLGMGPDGQGKNLVGKTLMQIRHNIRIQLQSKKREEDKLKLDNDIFSSYQAYVILQKELYKGDTLSDYIGKNPIQIIQFFLENNPEQSLDSLGINPAIKESIIKMYNRGQFPIIKKELEHPGYMVLAIRKDGLRNLQKMMDEKRIQVIIKLYTEHIIQQKYPHMDPPQIEKASSQLLSSLYTQSPGKSTAEVLEKYTKFKNKIVRLYNKGKLPKKLTRKIDEALTLITVPDDEEIAEAEQMKMSQAEEEDNEYKQKDDSSSTDDQDDPHGIKKYFVSDEKTRKNFLIQRIQIYTGESSNKYKNWTIDRLEEKLAKYEGSEAYKQPKETAGDWVVKVKHRNNRIDILKISATKPSEKDIEKLVKKYNSKYPSKLITKTQVFIKWTPKNNIVEIQEEKNNYEEELPKGFVKEFGTPLEIRPLIDQNEPQFREFSPIFEKIFQVDGLTYPSASIYITTMLLSHTGKTMDSRKKGLFMRGISTAKAREMLVTGSNTFLNPNQAHEVYTRENIQIHKELEETFARIAMDTKFQDMNLRILLLLTGNYQLLWEDPKDIFLGAGTKEQPGENIVGKILMRIREDYFKTNPTFPPIKDEDSIIRFMSKDEFMKTWINMRISDMCNTIYKFKQYLYKVTGQDEEIDSRFIKHILDNVFQPCSTLIAMSKTINIPVPDFFKDLVSSCTGMPIKLTKDYELEFNRINEEKEKAEKAFWGIKDQEFTSKKEFDIIAFAKRQSEELQKFLAKNPSQQEKEAFSKKQIAQAEKVKLQERIEADITAIPKATKYESFESKQRREWQELLEEINKPEHSPEFIKESLANLEKRQAQEQESKLDTEKASENAKERSNLLNELMKPKMSENERNKKIKELQDKQEKERIKHYKLEPVKKTKEEAIQHEQQMKEFRQRLIILNKQKKDEILHRNLTLQDISQVYWTRIVTMIVFLMQHIKQTNEQDIRKAIVTIEMMNSEKVSCENVSTNLDNEQDNCIASALANLLVGINAFKFQYGEQIPFDTPDIDLAGSIILNQDISDEKIEEAIPEPLVEEELEEKSMEEDFAAEESSNEEGEKDIYDEDEQRDSMQEDNVEFGMRRPYMQKLNNDLEQVKIILREIIQNEPDNLDTMAQYFINMIQTIKTFKMSERVKQNRINFFATIR